MKYKFKVGDLVRIKTAIASPWSGSLVLVIGRCRDADLNLGAASSALVQSPPDTPIAELYTLLFNDGERAYAAPHFLTKVSE